MKLRQQLPIDHFFAEEANAACFQCARPTKQWAELTHAVFLCLNCAAIYKELHWLNKIKSIGLDQWSEEEVRRMERGGNQSLRKFFEFYHLQNVELRTKLTSKAAQYYRQLLDGKQVGEQPTLQVGRQTSKESIPLTEMSPQQIIQTAKEKAFNIGFKTKEMGSKGIKKIQQKYESGQIKQGAIKAASKVASGASWLWGVVKDKVVQIKSDIKK